VAEVEALVTLAGHHLVTPALALAMRGNASVPADVRGYPEATLYLNRDRNARMLDALELATAALADHGIEPLLLKGAANLTDGLYPDPGMRIVGDLDLLIPAESASAASAILARAGFDDIERGPVRRAPRTAHHHLPMQRHRDTGIGIELHHAILALPYERMLDPVRTRQSARAVLFRGRALAIPTPTARVLHNIVHDQLVDGAYGRRSVSLRQLLELALLCRRYRDEIDWHELDRAFAPRYLGVLRHGLGSARLLGACPPIGSLPPAVRRLRRGIENPTSFLLRELRRGAFRASLQPTLLLNLLTPGSWAERTARWRRLAARPRA
jgi:hypothetical protein